jgi:hypothetical protein
VRGTGGGVEEVPDVGAYCDGETEEEGVDDTAEWGGRRKGQPREKGVKGGKGETNA